MRRSVTLNDNARRASLAALEDLVKAPTTIGSLRGLTATVEHAAAAAALPRPVRHGLQLLEHLLDVRRRAPLGARRHRLLAARAAEHGHAAAGHRRHRRRPGANEFAHGEGELPGQRRQYLHNNVYGPAIDDQGNADCERGPDRLHQAYNPLRDKSVKGDPYQRRGRPSRSRQPAPRPDLRAVRQGRQGRRPQPRPRARRRDVHRPTRRPRRRHREAGSMRRKPRRKRPVAVRRRAARRSWSLAVGTLPRLHEGDPVPPPLHDLKAVFPSANNIRPARPCGSPASTSARSPRSSHCRDGKQAARRDDADRQARACRSTTTRR